MDPLFGFHILTYLSQEPDAKLPFGKTANSLTQSVCPVKVKSNNPEYILHILIVLSRDPDANLPFDNVANVVTPNLCP